MDNTTISSLPSSPCKSDHPSLPNYYHEKTLFISVFETIIHTSPNPPPGGYDFALDLPPTEKFSTLYVTLRPGLIEFLQAVKKVYCFDIVTFTWQSKGYVPEILRKIDPTRELISDLLVNNLCPEPWNSNGLIDLTLTGRTVDQSVIIDNNPKLHVKQWCNAIKVNPFTGDPTDVELWKLFRFFELQENFIDVRNVIHVHSDALPMPPLPLPPTTRKTLFLDLDYTLIRNVTGDPPDNYDFATRNFYIRNVTGDPTDHYEFATKNSYIIKRPGVDKLLQVATDHDFEIVIFTARCRDYASIVIDWLDPNGLIAHRLYRDSCQRNEQGVAIKDLALTGRSLDRCIIIDDLWERVSQRENVVKIKPFEEGTQDSELTRLLRFFEIESRYDDLLDAVSNVNDSFSLMEIETMTKSCQISYYQQ